MELIIGRRYRKALLGMVGGRGTLNYETVEQQISPLEMKSSWIVDSNGELIKMNYSAN